MGLGFALPFFVENYIAVQNQELLTMLTWFVSEDALEKRTTKEIIYPSFYMHGSFENASRLYAPEV